MAEEYGYDGNGDAPFYVRGVFMRLGCSECDFCMFDSEQYEEEEGGVCPHNLWWTVIQRQKVMEKFKSTFTPKTSKEDQ